jgi:hypothetical protein
MRVREAIFRGRLHEKGGTLDEKEDAKFLFFLSLGFPSRWPIQLLFFMFLRARTNPFPLLESSFAAGGGISGGNPLRRRPTRLRGVQ